MGEGVPLWPAILIAAGTLVSEDLACVAAGLAVARGALGIVPATLGAFLGIYAGDLLLYASGRCLGRPALAWAPVRRLLDPDSVRRGSEWLARNGQVVIAVSRVVPGARLPTYFAAGLLKAPFGAFALWAVVAAALWAPLLVGGSALLGDRAASLAAGWQRWSGYALIAAAPFALAVVLRKSRAGFRDAPRRGASRWGRRRRLLVSSWRRLTRWEFWPPWAFYPPVALYVLWLGIRHRSLTLFTAANPGIEAGGFISESKSGILDALARGGAPVARFHLLRSGASPEARLEEATRFIRDNGLSWPVVLKPDIGQRGAGVAVIENAPALEAYLAGAPFDVILQEHVAGPEFGVFYYRYPGEDRGRILSITDKRLPEVAGDGRRSLQDLILDDDRAVCRARALLRAHASRLHEVPARGESVPLVRIGTHCRGAVFLDGSGLCTTALEDAVERASRGFSGFHFGRYDLRAPSVEEFQAGRGLRILELNGVTSEATDIYDPSHTLLDAYRRLFEQWRIAFEIGRLNRDRGHAPARPRDLVRLVREFRALRRAHAGLPA